MAGKKRVALSGVVAGQSAICTVGKAGKGLEYRGYAIGALAGQATFEEIAYLLIYGDLPTAQQLATYQQTLISLRHLPQAPKNRVGTDPRDSTPYGRDANGLLDAGNARARIGYGGTATHCGSFTGCLPRGIIVLVSLSTKWAAH